jgi:hypothetical protein
MKRERRTWPTKNQRARSEWDFRAAWKGRDRIITSTHTAVMKLSATGFIRFGRNGRNNLISQSNQVFATSNSIKLNFAKHSTATLTAAMKYSITRCVADLMSIANLTVKPFLSRSRRFHLTISAP